MLPDSSKLPVSPGRAARLHYIIMSSVLDLMIQAPHILLALRVPRLSACL